MTEKRQVQNSTNQDRNQNTRNPKAPPRKVMSNRGELVDFDVLKLKEQIKAGPKPETTVQRERFIDKKRRRTAGARKVNEMVAEQAENQRYAKEMIDAQRVARKIEEANKLQDESVSLDITAGASAPIETHIPIVPAPEPTPLDQPKRIGRRIR